MNIPFAFNRGMRYGAFIGASLSIATLAFPGIAATVGLPALALAMESTIAGAAPVLASGLLATGLKFIAANLVGAALGAVSFTALHIVTNTVPGLRDFLHEPDYTHRESSLRGQSNEHVEYLEPSLKKSRSFDDERSPLAGDYHIQVVENQGLVSDYEQQVNR
ncbi:MAG: hypothetical protein CMM93_05925 [Rickettsiales bacterium]|nr:hypothetical protein [Rickettsiales bacterium]